MSKKNCPHTINEIRAYLRTAGFTKIKFSKNFTGERFNVRNSKDLFVEAVRKL